MLKSKITKKKVISILDLEIVKRLKILNKGIITQINEVKYKFFLGKKTTDFVPCISSFCSTANGIYRE